MFLSLCLPDALDLKCQFQLSALGNGDSCLQALWLKHCPEN